MAEAPAEMTGRQLAMRVARTYLAPRWKGVAVALVCAAISAGLSGLLVQLLEPMFLDLWEGLQPAADNTRDSPYVFTMASMQAQLAQASPDAYGRTRILLDAPSMPTTALFMEKLIGGQNGQLLRSTENQIFTVVSGAGESRVGAERLSWSRGDVFVAPGWQAVQHHPAEDALLFCVSDLPVHEKLGFHRMRVEA